MKRIEIPLELTAHIMRDFTPASAMPFRGKIQFIASLLESTLATTIKPDRQQGALQRRY